MVLSENVQPPLVTPHIQIHGVQTGDRDLIAGPDFAVERAEHDKRGFLGIAAGRRGRTGTSLQIRVPSREHVDGTLLGDADRAIVDVRRTEMPTSPSLDVMLALRSVAPVTLASCWAVMVAPLIVLFPQSDALPASGGDRDIGNGIPTGHGSVLPRLDFPTAQFPLGDDGGIPGGVRLGICDRSKRLNLDIARGCDGGPVIPVHGHAGDSDETGRWWISALGACVDRAAQIAPDIQADTSGSIQRSIQIAHHERIDVAILPVTLTPCSTDSQEVISTNPPAVIVESFIPSPTSMEIAPSSAVTFPFKSAQLFTATPPLE